MDPVTTYEELKDLIGRTYPDMSKQLQRIARFADRDPHHVREVMADHDIAATRVPANVQTARGADIERSQALDLSAFLNQRLGSVHLNEVQGNPLQPDVNFRGFTASPLLASALGGASAIILGGSDAQKSAWLPKIAAAAPVGAVVPAVLEALNPTVATEIPVALPVVSVALAIVAWASTMLLVGATA